MLILLASNLASPSAGLRRESLRLLCRWQQPPLPSLAEDGRAAAAAPDTATSARMTAIGQWQQPGVTSSPADGTKSAAAASDKSIPVMSVASDPTMFACMSREEMLSACDSEAAVDDDTSKPADVTAGSGKRQPEAMAMAVPGHVSQTHPGVPPPESDDHVKRDGQLVQSTIEQGNVSDRHVARSDVLPLLLALEEDDPSLGLGRLVRPCSL